MPTPPDTFDRQLPGFHIVVDDSTETITLNGVVIDRMGVLERKDLLHLAHMRVHLLKQQRRTRELQQAREELATQPFAEPPPPEPTTTRMQLSEPTPVAKP